MAELAPTMQGTANVPLIKAILAEAKAEGLDPARIYNAAVETHPEEWPAPPDPKLLLP